ncbi:MAG: putative F420-dependent oxidoreductase, Rv2161c family, partial [Acidimicrobiia bacterium]|nr:putative F420-dependent oxidoreductase, Rv2161c family [Acidimicrobiia bacterium]
MELGLTIPHTGRHASPQFVRDVAQAADELGYGSLWAIDHVVMPTHFESLYTLGRKPARLADNSVSESLAPNYECMSTLLWVAGFTNRVKLGTGVAILPIRNPIYNARQLATLDVYSGGRVLYGVGVGWLKEEADAMQMPWDHRGARSEEHIAVMRHLWTTPERSTSFDGAYYGFGEMDPEPQPVQRPIPILIGGHSDIALERAGRIGDGWLASSMSSPRLQEHWDKVKAAAEGHGRDSSKMILVNGARVAMGSSASDPIAEPLSDVID